MMKCISESMVICAVFLWLYRCWLMSPDWVESEKALLGRVAFHVMLPQVKGTLAGGNRHVM